MKTLVSWRRLLRATIAATTAGVMFGFGTMPPSGAISLKDTGAVYAVMASGICKDPDELTVQQDAMNALRDLLAENLKLSSNYVTFLSPSGSSTPSAQSPTAEHLKAAIASIAIRAQPGDTLIFWYRGQANVVGDTLRLNLEGPDMTHQELAEALSAIKCRMMIIVLDCPGAGMAVETLTRRGHIIMCGARGDQPYATSFTGYFVEAFGDTQSDYDANGAVSILEAYRYAVTTTDALYEQKGQLKAENALLEDDGDGIPTQEPWKAEEETYDGDLAARVYFVRPPESTGGK